MDACCGVDHHEGGYTEAQKADLDRVLRFNRRMAAAIDDARDVTAVERLLDPDPLRYMWVDEGEGRISEFLDAAASALADAPVLPGCHRLAGRDVTSSGSSARPSVATCPDGRVLHAWIEWERNVGDRVVAVIGDGDPVVLANEPADCFRPTALFDAAGRAWVWYGRAEAGAVSVLCRRCEDGHWGPEERVSTTGRPSFNQEAVAHADGRVEICWQGPAGDGFGVYARDWTGGVWGPARLVSEGVEANVWDPAIAALPDGGTAYAWTEYTAGSYRIVLRTAAADGALSAPRPLTGGADYALHPSLAVTADGGLWCAFDVVTVAGHGGSGPTRLRPAEQVGADPRRVPGMRDSGESVPPELLPEVSAAIRVVRVDPDGLLEAEGELAPSLDTVPSGLPRLAADAAGGLVVAYRAHRRLPLMTYYWEVATQELGPDGWQPPTTFRGSDGTLEEPAVAPLADGVVVSWQGDGRLERALTWTEGFGGRECPFLLEHHGEVIWHGMHGTGAIRSASVPGAGPAAASRPLATPASMPDGTSANPAASAAASPAAGVVVSSERVEARAWATARRDRRRHSTEVGGVDYTVFWGDLHRHSLISRCTAGDDPSLEDFYRYSWDVCEYDFWAVTDHSENSTDYQWWAIQKIADLFRVDGRFVPLYGFEWTGLTGHQNVIYGDVARGAPIFSAYARGADTPAGLWESLARHPEFPALTIPHHPGSAMVPFDWDYDDPRFLRLAEVFQACRGNYEDDGCFRQYSDGTLPGTFVGDGLRRGRRLGLIASSDHGHGSAYLGAYAERLDRASIFEALAARRVFGATQRDLLVDFRIGETFMGGEARVHGPRELQIYARGYGELARIDIVRDGETVFSELPDLDLPEGQLAVPIRVEWGMCPETADWSGSLAVSGGEVLQTPYWSPEIVEAGPQRVAWVASTKSFGEPYGAQRGGVEVTLVGQPDAVVTVKTARGGRSATLGEIAAGVVELPVAGPGRLRLQPSVGGLASLGGSERRLSWTDASDAPAWYYVRVFQTDGELAWSSPIWIDPP